MSIKFEFLPNPGESILVTFNDSFRVLIDSCNSYPFNRQFSRLNIPVPVIDVLIITHIDQDHIGGAIRILRKKEHLDDIKYILFNEPLNCDLFFDCESNGNVSATDGDSLLNLLRNSGIQHLKEIYTENLEAEKKINSISSFFDLKLLSPDRMSLNELLSVWEPEKFRNDGNVSTVVEEIDVEGDVKDLAESKATLDDRIPNRSSIAFIMNCERKNYVFLGDAHIDLVCESLKKLNYSEENPLCAEFIKLSHHGSVRNINKEFIRNTFTQKYIIVNQSPKSKLPNKETIAKIVFWNRSFGRKEKIAFYISKESEVVTAFSDEDKNKYNFEIIEQAYRLEY